MPECTSSMYSPFFVLENISHHHFTWIRPNSWEIVNFVPIEGPSVPDLYWNKFIISYEFGPLQVKWWHQMFFSVKMEQYMEPELSGLFWVKMVARYIVVGSLGTHFMHMRVNQDIFLNFWGHRGRGTLSKNVINFFDINSTLGKFMYAN